MSIKQVLNHLRDVILQSNPELSTSVIPIQRCEGDETNDIHLLWMINEIKTSEKMGLTKCHRWIGYVQGVLIMKGYTNVTEQKEATRDWYKT